jgi:transposase InsO family protein
MDIHKNARSCPSSRAVLVKRCLDEGWKVAAAAAAIGMSERRGWHWIRQHRSQQPMTDRSSRPHHIRSISSTERQMIIELRRQRRWTGRRIAREVGRSLSTVSRVLRGAGLSRLKDLDPPAPTMRYEWDRPGALVHVDIKKLGRITGGGGWNCHDRPGRTRRGGYEYVHVCIDDHSRVAYAEIYPNEKAISATAFFKRAVTWFAGRGVRIERVLTDNGLCYRSHAFRDLCSSFGIQHKRTRPYRPQTNGKVERLNQTLLREWSHAFAFRSSAERQAALAPFLHFYNHHRGHTALAGQPPSSRLPLKNVLALDTEARRHT